MNKVIVHTKTGSIIGVNDKGKTIKELLPHIAPEHIHMFQEIDADISAEDANLYQVNQGKVVPKEEAKLLLAVKEIQQLLIRKGETLKNIL